MSAIRDMLVTRRLWPGQQVRQEEIASQLNLSRSPVREALKALESEGLVRHIPNRGYFASRWSAAEIEQVYHLRKVLETEVFSTLRPLRRAELVHLRALNAQLEVASAKPDVDAMLTLNHQFHFSIFSVSHLTVFIRELERLWAISEFYAVTYYAGSESRERVNREHRAMLRALESRDIAALIAVADEHRKHAAVNAALLFGTASAVDVRPTSMV